MRKKKNYRSNSDRCIKCGDQISRSNTRFCLKDYSPQKMLCANCNAVGSVIHRLKQHKPITEEECRNLPGFLRFDGDDEYYELLFYWWMRMLRNR